MHTENIRRILLASMAGVTLTTSFLAGMYFGPWLFASPQIPLQSLLHLWHLWGSFSSNFSVIVIGLIFGALVGLPRKWWWSIAICICLALLYVFTIIDFNSFNSLNAITSSLGFTLFLCEVGGLLRFTTQFPRRINLSRKTAHCFIQVTMILMLIGEGLFVGRLAFVAFDGPILFLSAYETAQARNWQIQKVEMVPDFLGDYYRTIRFYLSDGSTQDCLYNRFFAQEHGYDGIFDFKNMDDAQDAIICSVLAT